MEYGAGTRIIYMNVVSGFYFIFFHFFPFYIAVLHQNLEQEEQS